MQLLRAFTHFVFIRSKQTAIFSVTERQNHPYSFSKVFRESSRSQGYVTYIAFTSKRKFGDVAWPHDHERILNYQHYEKSSSCFNLIRVFLNKIQCLLLATLTYYRGTLCIVYLYQFSLLLDVNYNLLTNLKMDQLMPSR